MLNFEATLFLACAIQLGFAKTDFQDWEEWKTNFGKRYDTDEDKLRYQIWKDNFKIVAKHNEKFYLGDATYKMSMNSLADLSLKEFQTLLNANSSSSVPPQQESSPANSNSGTTAPDTFDWNSKGYVTPVKNQGQLGSCYAFSALEAVEGQYYKQTGKLLSLSEQQVVDCDQGGNGGITYKVYEYIAKVGGIQTEYDYPYVEKVQECKFDKSKVAVNVFSYKLVKPRRNENTMKATLSQVGPLSVSNIKVFQSFQFYHSGVYHEPYCDIPGVTGDGYHAMLATGYGTEDGNDYWMVKNSWGTKWGENGYIKMIRNKHNNCGIASLATYPVLRRRQPAAVQYETTTSGSGINARSTASMIFSALIFLFTFD